MPFNCPHCSKGIDGVVPKERFDEVNTLANQNKKDALAYQALRPQWDEAQTRLARIGELETQVAAMNEERVTATYEGHGITNPKIRGLFQAEFDEQAAAEGGEKDLGAYLKKLHELPEAERPAHLSPFIKAPAATTTTPATPASTTTRPPPLPTRTVEPAPPPVQSGRLAPSQLQTKIAEITAKRPPANATPAERATFMANQKSELAALEAAAKAPAAV